MSVKVCRPPAPLNLSKIRNNNKRPFTTTREEDFIPERQTNMLTSAAASRSVASNSGSPNQVTAQQRREALKLSFQRSFSEPLGGVAGLVLGVPSTPTIESPPSVSPSLHPPKRCRVMNTASVVATPKSLAPPPQSIAVGSISLPTSPCSESSTLQRTLLMKNVKTIEPNSLAVRMEAVQRQLSSNKKNNSQFLLIDCRPFIAYNVNHIRNAINVNCCDRFNRKRLQQGKATLADLATTKEGKELLKKRSWREVVVYDDSSDSLETLPASHTLFLVMNALVEDNREPVMLLGGLRDFQVTHRGLCEDHLMHNPPNSRSMMDSTASKFLPDLPSPSELCDTKDIENHPATQVLPHLYLGNMRDASDMAVLSRLNIRFILNVTAKTPAYTLPDGFHYKHLDAADNGQQNLRQFFEEAFDFIDEAKGAGTGVLVHCQAGISRSPTIAVAYLMKHYPMAMGDAYKFVKTRRSIISPNLNFMGQLWEFEQGLREAGGFTKESTTMQVTESNDNQTSSKKSFVAPGSTFNLGSETEAKSASAASGSASSPFMWSQSSEVSKSVDGIYSTPVMNGCSV